MLYNALRHKEDLSNSYKDHFVKRITIRELEQQVPSILRAKQG